MFGHERAGLHIQSMGNKVRTDSYTLLDPVTLGTRVVPVVVRVLVPIDWLGVILGGTWIVII